MRFAHNLCGAILLLVQVFLLGCENTPSQPPLETEADSLAWRITEAHGGLAAWEALPILRFDYVEETDSTEHFRAFHLWDRRNDRYRIEWPLDTDLERDSLVVVLFRPSNFDPENPRGSAIVGDVRLQGADLDDTLQEAYRRFVHDSFWLLAPFKLFEEGASRTLAPDSSTTDRLALELSFDDMERIPNNQLWLYVDRDAGTVRSWTLSVDNTVPSKSFIWSDSTTIDVGGGRLTLPTMKRSPSGRMIRTPVGQPGDAGALLTDLSNRLLPLD